MLADLLFQHGATFGTMFDFRFMPVPYILGDLLLAGLVQLFGPGVAGTIWLSIVLLSWPAALLFYARATGISRNAQGFLLLLSLIFCATDWFFLLAFTQYRLGIALMLVALGVAHLLRQRWTTAGFTAFCVLLAVGYFTHLIYVIFLAPCLVVSATVRLYFRNTSLAHRAAAPRARASRDGVAFRHCRSPLSHRGDSGVHVALGAPSLKAWGLQLELLRFGTPFAKILMILFTAAVVLGAVARPAMAKAMESRSDGVDRARSDFPGDLHRAAEPLQPGGVCRRARARDDHAVHRAGPNTAERGDGRQWREHGRRHTGRTAGRTESVPSLAAPVPP